MRSESGQRVDILERDEFLKHLRDALSDLHHADRLRQNPLAALFGVANRFDTPLALRRILTDAIKSLEPSPDEPPQSYAWRTYDSLFCCYVQQLSQQVVADQLGLSARQLRREQHAALEALAYRLWEQFDLENKLREGRGGQTGLSQSVTEELAWLKDVPPDSTVDPGETLRAIVDLTRSLAIQHKVSIELEVTDSLPKVAIHAVALSQILLNLLSAAIPRAAGNRICISAKSLGWEVKIEIRCKKLGPGLQSAPGGADMASLDMAEQLVDLCGCELVLAEDEGAFAATLILPAIEQLPVLVIDDNLDTLQLLQRYASNTRYRLVGTPDPEQALELVGKHAPQIIVLDVMMPQVDGWRVLGRLRQHPLTEHTPIVVCTILPQQALALSLGASAFIRKPLSRQAFLNALDQVVQMETASR
jgi:CheY-like chemotaxis protein